MDSICNSLSQFIEAEGVSCLTCKWCNHDNFDCVSPIGAHEVTNKHDFGTTIMFPIASAVRTHGGACKPEGKLYEPHESNK